MIFIDCFTEREENVKCDILSAYTALLRATRPPPALQMAIPTDNSPQALLMQRVSRRLIGTQFILNFMLLPLFYALYLVLIGSLLFRMLRFFYFILRSACAIVTIIYTGDA